MILVKCSCKICKQVIYLPEYLLFELIACILAKEIGYYLIEPNVSKYHKCPRLN